MTDLPLNEAGARFELGRVVGQTFAVLGRNFLVFFPLALVLVGIPQFGSIYASGLMIGTDAPDLLATVGITIAGVVFPILLQGALIRGVVDDLRGDKVRIGAMVGDAFRAAVSLFVVAILMGLGLTLGFMLLIIPGLFLAVRWAVAAPAAVVERVAPTSALGRSADLSRGNRWSVFGLVLIWGAVMLATTFGLEIAFGVFGAGPEGLLALYTGFTYGAVSAVLGTILALINAVGVAALYVELRRVKEGVDVSDLAKVFA